MVSGLAIGRHLEELSRKERILEDFEILLQEMSMDFEARLQQMSKEFEKRLKEGVQAHLAMLSNMPTTNRSISSTNPPLQPLTVKVCKVL